MPDVYWSGRGGCLLPALIVFNLFFGILFLRSVGLWLAIEAILVLIFMLKVRFMVNRINRQFFSARRDRDGRVDKPEEGIIDVPGQVVEDNR
ncbi:MAG: hypothetical protein PHW98_06170 [Candidatus Omnitrophica bacterium]|nr:hypothetical protein [Candidatus Omnitrophota bacterium]MDD5771742.1 hypothetical protein [Candidatus Omnitrophota bacterium]